MKPDIWGQIRCFEVNFDNQSLWKWSAPRIVFFFTLTNDNVIRVHISIIPFYFPLALLSYNSIATSFEKGIVDKEMKTFLRYLSFLWFFCENAIQTTAMEVKFSMFKLYREILYNFYSGILHPVAFGINIYGI
jgi:hypothetical protein